MMERCISRKRRSEKRGYPEKSNPLNLEETLHAFKLIVFFNEFLEIGLNFRGSCLDRIAVSVIAADEFLDASNMSLLSFE